MTVKGKSKLFNQGLRKCMVCGKIKPMDENNFTKNRKHPGLFRRKCLDCQKTKQEGYKCNTYTHGMSKTRFCKIYYRARVRCNNPHIPGYNWYGGKGIKVERESFEEFYKDMYEEYIEHVKIYGEKNTTLDRKDGDKNYCKENCRWATYKVQQNNRCDNHIFLHKGKNKTLSQIVDETGITRYHIVHEEKKGLSIDDTIVLHG